MERAEIKAVVVEEVERLAGEESFGEASILSDDLGLDSLDAVDLVLGLEKRLKIAVPGNEETDKLKDWTVERLVNYVLGLTDKDCKTDGQVASSLRSSQ